MKKNLFLILGGVVLFLFIVITAFMWYRIFYNPPQGGNSVSVLQIQLDKNDGVINQTNAVPIEAENIATVMPYNFSVTNTSSNDGIYKILLEEPAVSDDPAYQSQNQLSRSQLGYQLILNNQVIKTGMLSDINNNILDERSIAANAVNNYQLRVFISSNAFNTAWQNKFYHYKVNIQTEEN